MKSKAWGITSLILRLIAAGVFLYAGWQKLGAPQEFADSIAAYQLLPAQLIDLLALALPPLELIVGCLLLIGWQRRVAAFSALILTGIFAVAISSAIARGLTIDCGCFGAGTPSKGDLWLALLRDLCLGAALLVVYIREIRVAREASALANSEMVPESRETGA
jgi:uncharacterized membrane protein YphA (DoxX/SURF4 family)